MTNPVVRVKDITKTYGDGRVTVPVLRGVSLDVTEGEWVSVMGPSGCGKSTLLNCASGLDRIDGGSVLVEGEDIHAMSERKRTAWRARRTGFVFQGYNLVPVLSAVENVEMPLLLGGVRPREARRKAVSALARVGLGERSDHLPAQLSGGQQQRVAIARGIVHAPAIVWADEPTGALDSASTSEVLALLRELHADGLTLIMVTHDPEVAAYGDREVHMLDGRVDRVEDNNRSITASATPAGGDE
ncbi:ABC transporter ATP-binding protein [Nocardiopsis sp. L17-MgMaSL7]|uniref:ABC transporter ATP-binding protein n=1 Tax=Nocardiopsis sp. L17-MgMaSL7 TaxID=1938893 RepID=UPI00034AB6AD|nr:ABC transporter ATP-binding protein [Nocardiopsis sp. L17-MgMaSL7]PWV57410.1 putative ABC transport system ATP-binding protein [Nocardiopsis sp. L17-MgMaSL7]